MKIAFVTTGSPNYYSVEYGVHTAALLPLKELELQGLITLIDIPEEIRTAEQLGSVFERLREADMILVQCGGFTDGNIIPGFARLSLPLCIWAIDEPTDSGAIQLHSLVTQNLFFSVLKKYCRTEARLYQLNGKPDMSDCMSRFRDILAVERLSTALNGGRICQIGAHADGFLNLIEDETMLKNRFGILVDHMDISGLVRRAESFSGADVSSVLEKVLRQSECHISSDKALENSARIYLALREIAEENGYLGMAVSCWSELQEQYGIVPCAAFSWLTEYEGIPVACEGDIGGLLSMTILQRLSGCMPTLLDLTRFDREKDALLFWHCGFSPASLAKGRCRLITHPMLNRRLGPEKSAGVSQDFCFKEGKVSVLRITGKDMKLFCFEANIRGDMGEVFTGTGAWLTDFSSGGRACTAEEILSLIMREGVEHHYALVMADGSDRLRMYAQVNGFEVIER